MIKNTTTLICDACGLRETFNSVEDAKVHSWIIKDDRSTCIECACKSGTAPVDDRLLYLTTTVKALEDKQSEQLAMIEDLKSKIYGCTELRDFIISVLQDKAVNEDRVIEIMGERIEACIQDNVDVEALIKDDVENVVDEHCQDLRRSVIESIVEKLSR